MQTNPPSSIETPGSQSFLGGRLDYRYTRGTSALPCVIYLHGYASDMMATKAQFLGQACAARGQSYLRFSFSGNGNSTGKFEEGTIGQWIADALTAIDSVTDEDFVLVGSSMGGWIGLHCALKRKGRIKAFVGIAAAPDFTEAIWSSMGEIEQKLCESSGYYEKPSSLGESLRLYNKLIQEGRNHLLLNAPIDLSCPVVLLQGREDKEVPWPTAERIQKAITAVHAEIIMIEDGDHRLARPQDLERLDQVVVRLSQQV